MVLYYRLLDRFNRAGWPENVPVDTLKLMVMSGCQSKGAAYRARDALVQAGFIRYEKGRKGKATTYFLSDILSIKKTESGTVNGTESGTENETANETHKERPKTKTKKKTFSPSSPYGESVEEVEESVRDQVEYVILCEEYGKDLADEVITLITDILYREGSIAIGKTKYPADLVHNRMRSLTFEHVCYALDSLGSTDKVRNPYAYLLTVLYNAPTCCCADVHAKFNFNTRNT